VPLVVQVSRLLRARPLSSKRQKSPAKSRPLQVCFCTGWIGKLELLDMLLLVGFWPTTFEHFTVGDEVGAVAGDLSQTTEDLLVRAVIPGHTCTDFILLFYRFTAFIHCTIVVLAVFLLGPL